MSDLAQRYRKLGGFLLFLVIMTFFVALTSVMNLLFSKDGFVKSLPGFGPVEAWFQLLIVLCSIYTIVIQIMFSVMIIKRDQRYLRIWQLFYIGTFVSAAATLLMHLTCGFPPREPSAFNSPEALGLATDVFAFLRVPIGLTLFTLYNVKSVRVRTYMGSDKYLKLAFFTKKAVGPAPLAPDLAPADPDEEG
jgi:hypothetical protein